MLERIEEQTESNSVKDEEGRYVKNKAAELEVTRYVILLLLR